jgi:hypothetical protein
MAICIVYVYTYMYMYACIHVFTCIYDETKLEFLDVNLFNLPNTHTHIHLKQQRLRFGNSLTRGEGPRHADQATNNCSRCSDRPEAQPNLVSPFNRPKSRFYTYISRDEYSRGNHCPECGKNNRIRGKIPGRCWRECEAGKWRRCRDCCFGNLCGGCRLLCAPANCTVNMHIYMMNIYVLSLAWPWQAWRMTTLVVLICAN